MSEQFDFVKVNDKWDLFLVSLIYTAVRFFSFYTSVLCIRFLHVLCVTTPLCPGAVEKKKKKTFYFINQLSLFFESFGFGWKLNYPQQGTTGLFFAQRALQKRIPYPLQWNLLVSIGKSDALLWGSCKRRPLTQLKYTFFLFIHK